MKDLREHAIFFSGVGIKLPVLKTKQKPYSSLRKHPNY